MTLSPPALQVLVSTMDRRSTTFLKGLNLSTPALVINQTTHADLVYTDDTTISVINSSERGLSRSRNLAIDNASSPIIVLADDDITYTDDYAETITTAHRENDDADIIAFIVNREGGDRTKRFSRTASRLNRLTALRVSSVEITVKLERLRRSGVRFDERFGSGSTYFMGEDIVFINDCIRSGLRVDYIPVEIATVDTSSSSWFKGFDRTYFRALGAVYRRLFPLLFPLALGQFLVRKHSLYRDKMSIWTAAKFVLQGALESK